MDLLQKANNLSKSLSRKSKSGTRIESPDTLYKMEYSEPKIAKENMNRADLIQDNDHEKMLHNIDIIDNEAEVEEQYTGGNLLKSINHSLNNSSQNWKRSISEIHKSMQKISK